MRLAYLCPLDLRNCLHTEKLVRTAAAEDNVQARAFGGSLGSTFYLKVTRYI